MPGSSGYGAYGNGPSRPSYSEMTAEQQAQAGAEAMMNFMQSCPGKSVFAGVSGFALGGVFGLFMASVCVNQSIYLHFKKNNYSNYKYFFLSR